MKLKLTESNKFTWEDTCDDIGGQSPLESLTGTFSASGKTKA